MGTLVFIMSMILLIYAFFLYIVYRFFFSDGRNKWREYRIMDKLIKFYLQLMNWIAKKTSPHKSGELEF